MLSANVEHFVLNSFALLRARQSGELERPYGRHSFRIISEFLPLIRILLWVNFQALLRPSINYSLTEMLILDSLNEAIRPSVLRTLNGRPEIEE